MIPVGSNDFPGPFAVDRDSDFAKFHLRISIGIDHQGHHGISSAVDDWCLERLQTPAERVVNSRPIKAVGPINPLDDADQTPRRVPSQRLSFATGKKPVGDVASSIVVVSDIVRADYGDRPAIEAACEPPRSC